MKSKQGLCSVKFENLYGKRIDLIEINMEGLTDMYEYSKNPSFYTYMEYSPHRSLQETRQYLEKLIGRSIPGSGHYWFIFLKSEKKVIGTFGIMDIDRRKGSAKIGYGISFNCQGHGYFHEALTLVLKHVFLNLGFHRILAITRADNSASVKALEKGGFRKEGTMREYYLSVENGKRHDAEMLAILKNDFCHMEQK